MYFSNSNLTITAQEELLVGRDFLLEIKKQYFPDRYLVLTADNIVIAIGLAEIDNPILFIDGGGFGSKFIIGDGFGDGEKFGSSFADNDNYRDYYGDGDDSAHDGNNTFDYQYSYIKGLSIKYYNRIDIIF